MVQRPDHIPSLDGLRGLAAFAVVLSHLSEFGLPAIPIGDVAVATFFSLSGFLMAVLYLPVGFSVAAVRRYAVSRIARIVPIYLTAIAATVAISATFADYPHPIRGAVEILRHVLLLGSSGVFWSIPPEIQFYAFFVAFWWGVARKGLYAAILFAACLLAVVAVLGFPGPGILLPSKIHFFLLGAFAGCAYLTTRNEPTPAFVPGLAIVLMTAIVAETLMGGSVGFGYSLALAFVAALVVHLVAREPPMLAAVLASVPMRFLGRISFSLYLFHMPILYLAVRAAGAAGLHPVPSALAALAAVPAVCGLIHRTLERPLQASATHLLGRALDAAPPPRPAVRPHR